MKNKNLIIISVTLIICALFLGYFYFHKISPSTQTTIATEITNTTEETDESIIVELPPKEDSHLKLTAIGDIMCHNSQYIDAYSQSEGTYNFSYVFEDIKE